MKIRSTLLLATLFVGLAGVHSVKGALIAYEGFDYSPGNLNGLSGGTGWSDAWAATVATGGASVVEAPGMTYPSLTTAGNRAFIQRANQNARTLSAGVLGSGATADSTVWISFLGQRTGANNVRLFRVGFYEGSTANDPKFLVGEGNNDATDVWKTLFGGSDSPGTTPVTSNVPITTQSLLLLKIDYNPSGLDDLFMWVNPDLSAGEPTNMSPSYAGSSLGEFDLAFSVVSMRAGTLSGGNEGQGYFDEIRIGDTFADVTPVPEPMGILLGALGISGVAIVVRRKQTSLSTAS